MLITQSITAYFPTIFMNSLQQLKNVRMSNLTREYSLFLSKNKEVSNRWTNSHNTKPSIGAILNPQTLSSLPASNDKKHIVFILGKFKKNWREELEENESWCWMCLIGCSFQFRFKSVIASLGNFKAANLLWKAILLTHSQ